MNGAFAESNNRFESQGSQNLFERPTAGERHWRGGKRRGWNWPGGRWRRPNRRGGEYRWVQREVMVPVRRWCRRYQRWVTDYRLEVRWERIWVPHPSGACQKRRPQPLKRIVVHTLAHLIND